MLLQADQVAISTVQFIHKNQKELTLATVQSISLGQKDAQRSLFSLWKEVFQLSTVKRYCTRDQRGCVHVVCWW